MRVAALDLGSNTSLLLIADMEGARLERVIVDETTVTKMGQGVHANRRFHPEALERMRECLRRYGAEIRRHQCDKVVAVATSAARDVKNAEELVHMASENGIPIHIVTGETEARLTFMGALSDRVETGGCAVIDVGGGSTEVISQSSGGPRGQSFDVGSVRLTEMFVEAHPVDSGTLARLIEFARAQFSSAGPIGNGVRELVAVAGTPTTLAALEQAREFSESFVNGYTLTVEAIDRWISRLAAMTVEERERLPGMQPKRADVIVAGAVILREAIVSLNKTCATVSTRGVRYGAAMAWREF